MRAFIDTGGFAALYQARDEHHSDAREIWNRFKRENALLYTSNYVVSETIILLRVRAGFSAAERFGDDIFSSASVHIVRANEHHEKQAWSIFKKFRDQEFSFVDCCSFAIMRDLRLTQAFAFDHHFSVIGFELLRG